MHSFRTLIVLAACLCGGALAYSGGAPLEACDDMTPQHGIGGQNTSAPYSIDVSPKRIRAGDRVRLTIAGKARQDTVRGFLVQARLGDERVGHFEVEPSDAGFAQTLDCGGKRASAVTHKKHDAKDDRKNFSVIWVAPKDLKSPVVFQSTIALNGGVFWVATKSDVLRIY